MIDTIVEWIDDNLHQPLRIDEILQRQRRVFEMASATAVFTVQRKVSGATFAERKLLLAARDLRDTDQRVYDICLKYGFDSAADLYPYLYPYLQSAAGRIAKRTTAFARTERRPVGIPVRLYRRAFLPFAA